MNIDLYKNISNWSIKLILIVTILSIIPISFKRKNYLSLSLSYPLIALILAITYELANIILVAEVAPCIVPRRIDLVFIISPMLMVVLFCGLTRWIIVFKKNHSKKNERYHFFVFTITLFVALVFVWFYLVQTSMKPLGI
jgi:hypothetical protein